MDPRKLFADERFKVCAYCGDSDMPFTKDHVPSKVLLDDPFPSDLPTVLACNTCNNSFSVDEPYLACFVECAISQSVAPDKIQRQKVKRILKEQPNLSLAIQQTLLGDFVFTPDMTRISNVLLKLARGHVAYELSELRLDDPEYIKFIPISYMSLEDIQEFETPPEEFLLPEIGSRAFLQAVIVESNKLINNEWCNEEVNVFVGNDWCIIQPDRYRYLVSYSDGIIVRLVLSEYFACEVAWLI